MILKEYGMSVSRSTREQAWGGDRDTDGQMPSPAVRECSALYHAESLVTSPIHARWLRNVGRSGGDVARRCGGHRLRKKPSTRTCRRSARYTIWHEICMVVCRILRGVAEHDNARR